MTKSKATVALQGTEESKYSLPIPSVLYPGFHLPSCYSWQAQYQRFAQAVDDKGTGEWGVRGVGWLRGCFLMAGVSLLRSLPMMAKAHSD